jgi:hypothetical protein
MPSLWKLGRKFHNARTAVFGNQAFGPAHDGYFVTCSACGAVLGVLPNADHRKAVVAKEGK